MTDTREVVLPQTIDRAALIAACQALGFDPDKVIEMHITPQEVLATVAVTGPPYPPETIVENNRVPRLTHLAPVVDR